MNKSTSRKRKYRALIILPLALTSIVLININNTTTVSFRVRALEVIIDNPSHINEFTVLVEGEYRRRPFASYREFSGFIEISNAYETQIIITDLVLSGAYHTSHHVATIQHLPNHRTEVFGLIYTIENSLLYRSMIVPFNQETMGLMSSMPILVFGVDSRDDAVDFIIRMIPQI